MGRTKAEIEAGARIFGQAANTLGIFGSAALNASEFDGKQIIVQCPAIIKL